MIKKILFGVLFVSLFGTTYGQQYSFIKAELNDTIKSIYVQQRIEYLNQSQDTLYEIYLNDWISAFSNKRTPLARRFYEDYDRDFHFARQEKRGATTINSISDQNFENVSWSRLLDNPDLIKVIPTSPVTPGEKYVFNLNYSVKIPADDFTRYGYSNKGTYKLKYWYITPGVYKDGWQVYSHKNMNDYYIPKMELDIEFRFPAKLVAISPLIQEDNYTNNELQTIILKGSERLETELFLTNNFVFEEFETDSLKVITNMSDDGISPVLKSRFVKRTVKYLEDKLGKYPHDKLVSTQELYSANPVYGLNQLPKFLRPFPEGFNYDLKQFKTITQTYLQNSLMLNPRKDKWVYDAIQTYLMMDYIDTNYPDLKVIGKLSEMFGIRWFHAADLNFNSQYALLYLYAGRKNVDQALSTPQDSLTKFNKNLANPYKAGAGLNYLDYFLEDTTVKSSIKEFFQTYQLKASEAKDFETILKANAEKDIDWFFEDYVGSREKIDYKIKSIKKKGDSLKVTVRNRTGNNMPITLYGLNDDNIVYKTWIENTRKSKTVTVPAKGIDRLALNYEAQIPEINQRNNYRSVNRIIHKPIQFRLFKDVEDPRYTQIFFMPDFEYNLYDGPSLGAKIYNATFLNKNFEFEIAPLYGLNSQTIVGSAAFSHQIFFEDQRLYSLTYGAGGSRFSFGYDLYYQRFTPYLSLAFRNSLMRNSQKEYFLVRNVNVSRDQNIENPLEIPDYSVFNLKYSYSNPGLVEYVKGLIDFQVAEKFGKSSLTLEYRKLLKNDRQVNLRFFGGAFMYNDLPNSDYFSFALDRPTDYLYDYNYYGRSETSGLFSQQIIMAEGGFKSMLEPKFANQWITTVNGSTTIWKWIFAYADAGLIKNKNHDAKFLYDSGIRASIIQDYFEIFFPVYSSDGWEFNGGNYDQKIRFIATLDVKTIIGIFTREWL